MNIHNECYKVECDLCGMVFDNRDKDYELRIIRHTDYHNELIKGKTRVHHGKYNIIRRNTTMGIPLYKPYFD